ncbi:RNA metabolism protein [Lithospermum erythrorhizon]|uniref:RNA metabolism protein n=1 Tax=Lithospermum erythrorhizon TaxID=34254 RepID=A0AAV3RM00_LITER
MANSSLSTLTVWAESECGLKHMPNSRMSSPQAPSPLIHVTSHGPVAILWDIENCPVPSDVRPEDVAINIRMALRVHPVIKGAVTLFSAYGDFNAFPRWVREGCQRTGVKLIDVPNGRKDAADKAILVDMFLFALDNRPPSSIMLISGDVDFAPALHILGQRGYTVILVIPSRVGVSSALSNAGQFVWDWPSVARGEGFVPSSKALGPPNGGGGLTELSGLVRGCQSSDISNNQTDEEAIVYKGLSESFYSSRDFSMISVSLSERNRTSKSMPCHSSSRPDNLSSGMHDVSIGTPTLSDQNELMWVQPGDLNGLKGQLVKLLELFGGCLLLTRLPAEYQKLFGMPLYISEYGALKLVNLLKKMADAMAVEGKGQRKFVYLLKSRIKSTSPIVLLRREEKGSQEETADIVVGPGSSDEFSEDERVVVEERNHCFGVDRSLTKNPSLEKFKYELQEIFVSYSCRIFLGCFEAVYQQKYKKPLKYENFAVTDLEELLGKVNDVVILVEEPETKRKFLVAVVS